MWPSKLSASHIMFIFYLPIIPIVKLKYYRMIPPATGCPIFSNTNRPISGPLSLPTIRFNPHFLAYSSRNCYILGNLYPVSMWITGKGIFPKKAFRHNHNRVVESFPTDQSTAISLNLA